MNIKTKIKFVYNKEFQAKTVHKSLKPDNMGFIHSYVENNNLIYELEGKSLRTILATVDDLIFCEMMSEKVLDSI
ncbi:MAG: KEOPS complex subunit Pcc1 [Methanobacteriaceae archaeon]|nr:KEOPS complex subunit Pcc1 [Methanobacteriaceae archaeon]